MEMDGVSYGKINSIVENEKENREFFTPFINYLRSVGVPEEESDEIEDDVEEVVEDTPKKRGRKAKA